MKFKAPPGETGINIGGQQFNVDDKGEITLPDEGHYPMPVGYERVVETAPVAPATSGYQHAEE